MKRLVASIGLALMATPALAAAGDMSVAIFLAKADALRAKGPLALLSSDMNVLKTEGTAAGQAYRAQLAQERVQGRPSSCPPQGTRISSDQLLSHLRAYPAPARPRTTMRTAMADYFIKTFPCA
ncbi:MAG TPA: hypothetical protein VHG29_06405 [Novosphingobium sp.]|nr:hypothetical protein [Novosphingobium sp.]